MDQVNEALNQAAAVAQAFLDAAPGGGKVLADQALENAEVFVFPRDPAPIDDQGLVVDKSTNEAHLVVWPVMGPKPYSNLVPVVEEDTTDAGPLMIING